MKVYTYSKDGATAIILAFNRGHATKQLSKALKEMGKELSKDDERGLGIEEVNVEAEKKGKVIFLG